MSKSAEPRSRRLLKKETASEEERGLGEEQTLYYAYTSLLQMNTVYARDSKIKTSIEPALHSMGFLIAFVLVPESFYEVPYFIT